MEELDQNLFAEFPPVSTEEWEALILQDLKGADYTKKLIWKTDGMEIRPYYRAEDLSGLEYLNTLPGTFPFTRGNVNTDNSWEIRQDIPEKEIGQINAIARKITLRGAEGIGVHASLLKSKDDLLALLEGIDHSKVSIHFISAGSYKNLAAIIAGTFPLKGSFNFDPIGYLLVKGDFYETFENSMEEAATLLQIRKESLPNMKMIAVNGSHFHNAGASPVQELAYSLAAGNEYLAALTAKNLSADTIAPAIQFNFSVGSDYFIEIAKFRAARLLWAQIVEQYQPQSDSSMKIHIHASTSFWNKTLYDPYVNMLRTTTEAMAAAIAGCESISIAPFDAIYKTPDEFSMRIARNQQVILREESWLDKIVDVSAGSYYIENLTDKIASEAWNIFKLIEEKGGFLSCVKSGFVQDEIEKTAKQKNQDIAFRKKIILGTNQYPNLQDQMLDQITKKWDETLTETPYKVLKPIRGAMAFENIRLDTERFVKKGNAKPVVFLFPIGNPTMRKARAGFASNFFSCAGFNIVDHKGFQAYEEGIKSCAEKKPGIVVICSSDEEYPELVPNICKGIKEVNPETIIVVAGYPQDSIDMLKSSGVDDFIHVKTEVAASLKAYQKKLGVI